MCLPCIQVVLMNEKYFIDVCVESTISFSQLFIASTQPHWCRVPELEPWARDYPDIVKNLRFVEV